MNQQSRGPAPTLAGLTGTTHGAGCSPEAPTPFSPVESLLRQLLNRLNSTQESMDELSAALMPVKVQGGPPESGDTARPQGDCHIEELILQAIDRVDDLAGRIKYNCNALRI
jgi:hypothetical protein